MTRIATAVVAIALMIAASHHCEAQVQAPQFNDGNCLKGCCDSGCGGNWFATIEATVFSFHESGGIQSADSDPDQDFGYQVFPRIEIGTVDCSGWGYRVRYWGFDDEEDLNGDLVTVNTFNVDLEAFQTFAVTECISLELASGVRYNRFDMFEEDESANLEFDGLGLTFGLEARRHGCRGDLFASARFSILAGDMDYDDLEAASADGTYEDHISDQLELAVGYSWCQSLGARTVDMHIAYEMQRWSEYGLQDTNDDDYLVDVGFVGFVIGGTISY